MELDMSDIIEMLQQSLGEEGVAALSERIGADSATTKNAIGAALPALVAGAARQGATSDGVAGLLQFLDRDGDGAILDDVQGFLSDGGGASGSDLVSQLFGNKQARVQQGVSKASGLDAGATKNLLMMLAPMVLGALTKQKQSKNLDQSAFASFLRSENESVEKKTGGMIGQLMDQDGDGDFDLSDVAKLAIGKLFGGQ
jgi:hypothetical protein